MVRGRVGIGAQATAASQATVVAAVVVPRPVPGWLPDPGSNHATAFLPAGITAVAEEWAVKKFAQGLHVGRRRRWL